MDDDEELTARDIAVYRAVLSAQGLRLTDVARALASSADELDKPIARLSDLGLVRVEDDEQLTALSPMLAEASVLATEDLELAGRLVAAERRRDAIRQLLPDWNAAFEASGHERAVDVVTDQSAMANMYVHHAHRCREEMLFMTPPRQAPSRTEGRARATLLHAARRGVATRAMYQHGAVGERKTLAYLRELAGLGGQIRLAAAVPARALLVDRAVAILPIAVESCGPGLAIVRDPHVITWLAAGFEQQWADAAPLGDVIGTQRESDADLDSTRVAVLRLMAEGEKDEAISRRLSISVRTCRRHIADYMAQVGASSRFQAGVIAARSGHLDGPPGQ